MVPSLFAADDTYPPATSTEAGPAPVESQQGGSRWQAVGWYTGVLLASLVLLVWSMKLWKADLSVPLLARGDAIFHQALIKGVLKNGWYLRNPSLGIPFGLEMYDFPMADHLHFLAVKIIGLATRNVFPTFNLYYLLTFPLTALSALFALRRFRVAYPAAALASLLFTFLPYHFVRFGHLHLAAYYLIPLTVLVVLRIYLGRLPLYHLNPSPGGSRWHLASWPSAGAVLVCALTGISGGYYAFFACFLFAVAGVASSWLFRRLAPLGVAAALIAVIILAVGVTLYPTYRHRQAHGPNPAAKDNHRLPGESEIYGLKVAQMLLPISDHRLKPLAALRQHYLAAPRPLVNENEHASLGALGSVGFLWLLGRLLLRGRPTRPFKLLDALAVLTAAGTLFATVGGFGALVGLLVATQIRCYNRISVYLAFLALFGLALVLDRLVRRYATSRWKSAACYCGLGGLLVLGILDQTSASAVPPYAELTRDHEMLTDFVGRVEASLPRGSWVYQLPFTNFPEGRPLDYEPFRPYLYSRRLCWSFGAIEGREGDSWLRQLNTQPLSQQLKAIALMGFAGVQVDRRGYPDAGAAVEAELSQLLRAAPLVSRDGRMTFFPLEGYTRELRASLAPEEWERLRRRALTPVLFLWRQGFYPTETIPQQIYKWCRRSGEVIVQNPSDAPRKVNIRLDYIAATGRPCHLRIQGTLFNHEGTVDGQLRPLATTLLVPPGEHTLRFTCDGVTAPGDPRDIVFRVVNFACSEVD